MKFKVHTFHKYQELNKIHLIQNKFKIQDQFLNNQKNKVIVFQEHGNKDSLKIQFNRHKKRIEMKEVNLNMIQ